MALNLKSIINQLGDFEQVSSSLLSCSRLTYKMKTP